ncbi:MAG: response regulator transcription factor [Candidatus Methylomirabilales bacterium]
MRLLLIEDDSRIARFIKRGLEAERYLVDVAADGRQGIEMGQTETYDLIILDIILPITNGIQVCQHLRSHRIQTPILMLTAKDSVEDKVEGLGVGADDYLTKPFAFEELLARVQALLRRPRDLDLVPTLQVADLVLDKNAHEVKRAEKLIELTPKEFALLAYLMRRPNRVLSRTMIEEQVWGYQHDPLTNVVDVYVRRLRQKIDHGFEHQLIYTVRGAGYTLKA